MFYVVCSSNSTTKLFPKKDTYLGRCGGVIVLIFVFTYVEFTKHITAPFSDNQVQGKLAWYFPSNVLWSCWLSRFTPS